MTMPNELLSSYLIQYRVLLVSFPVSLSNFKIKKVLSIILFEYLLFIKKQIGISIN